MKIKLDKWDNENTNTESENDSSENSDRNGFQHLKNNTFLKSNKSEYESEDYTDNKTNDEKDSDNKNQVNDDSEVIDDWVSV